MHADAEVIFVSAAPLNLDYPGGFVVRDRSLVEAVARRRQTRLVFLSDDPAICETAPPSVQTVETAASALSRTDLLSPRQATGSALSNVGTGLVVPLTPNCAHLARGHRAVVMLEEAWERALRAPCSARERLSFMTERARYHTLYRRVGRSARAVVVITERERAHFARFIPPAKLITVPYGVDLDFFAPRDKASEFDVLIVGAVNTRREQRVEEFVSAIVAQRPGTRIAIVGGSPRESVRSLASATVVVTGRVADVRDYYAMSKVVAVPTASDVGIKTTLLQAWAMERAVVSTIAVAGAVPSGPTRSAGSATALAGEALALLDDPVERNRLAKQGAEYVTRFHDLEHTTRLLVSVIESAIEPTSE